MTIEVIRPDWSASAAVAACTTTRIGGISGAPWTSLNLADHVGDDPVAVAENRKRLVDELDLPSEPHWLDQVHGTRVRLAATAPGCSDLGSASRADACFSQEPGQVCAVLTADCLPVLVCNSTGTAVAAVHAGWRGLLTGVIEQAVAMFDDPPGTLLIWLGPAIGPEVFEVGTEVRAAFVEKDSEADRYFKPHREGHYLANLYGLARQRLARLGIGRVYGGGLCTFGDAQRFYSYRRDGISGRMASLIWLRS